MNPFFHSLASGLAGAVVLTVLHETVRRFRPDAPRADVLGMRALASGFRAAGKTPPPDDKLHPMALGGDLVANSLYYSLVGLWGAKRAVGLGAGLGALAGVGALVLPGPMGLGEAPTNRTPETQLLTVAWYLAGGLAAGAAFRLRAGQTTPHNAKIPTPA